MQSRSFYTLLCSLLLFGGRLYADPIVLSAQQSLASLGYYHGPFNGTMTSQTSGAVTLFQRDNHLTQSGTLTQETVRSLGIVAPKNASFPDRQQPNEKSYMDPGYAKALADLFVGGPMLSASPEIQTSIVRKAQDDLRLLGYYHGPVNGLPDPYLKQCLKAYQKDSRFKASGRLDKITLQGLNIDPEPYTPGR